MKKWDRIIALCLVLGLILAGCGENTGTGTDAVYVDSVGKLAGINGFAGVQNRFGGTAGYDEGKSGAGANGKNNAG